MEWTPPEVSLDQAIEMALQACRNNQADKAMGLFDDILTAAPQLDQVWHLNAQLLLELKRYPEAMDKVNRALELAPDNEDYRFTQALLHYHKDELVAAEQILLDLKGRRPDQRTVLELLQQIYQRQQKPILVRKIAREIGEVVEEQTPLMVELDQNLRLAAEFIDKNQLEQACMLLDGVLMLRPDNIKAHWLSGMLYYKQGELKRSCAHYDRIIHRFTHPKLILDYVKSLLDSDQSDTAIEILKEGIENFANDQSLRFMLASALFKKKDWKAARRAFRDVMVEGPESNRIAKYKLLTELKCFLEHGKIFTREKSEFFISELESVWKHLPDDTEIGSGLGYILELTGKYEESWKVLRQVAGRSENDVAYWNLHPIYRAYRNHAEYYDCYRKGIANRFGAKGLSFIQPKIWQGESLSGKQVTILGEQGVGDELLYAQNYQWIINQAKRVVVYCEPRLKSCFERIFPGAMFVATSENNKRVYPGFEELVSQSDYVIPAGDIMGWVFQRHAGTLAGEHRYFKPVEERADYWKARLRELSDNPKVGVCWRSGHVNAQRSVHYLSVGELDVVLQNIPGVEFINLMYSECSDELGWLNQQSGITVHHFEEIDLKDDFEDTAALISQLDLVISPLISVWELAEAVGTPTISFYGDYFESDRKIIKNNFWFPDAVQISLPPFTGEMRDKAITAIADQTNKALQSAII